MKDMSIKRLLALSRRARIDGVGRLRMILDRADPADVPLRRYLQDLSVRQEECLKEAELFDSKVGEPSAWRPDEVKTRRLLTRFFPSVSQHLGSGHVNREAAMHYVDRLEEELTRFCRTLATRAPDDDSRSFFMQEVESEKSRLKLHREVLL